MNDFCKLFYEIIIEFVEDKVENGTISKFGFLIQIIFKIVLFQVACKKGWL